ncbi:MAG: molybdenum cofactor guanylyltransferase [Acidobacteria bacterium]|nr:molybdenum cofactor guanylyltransferase [Acidobacteriota bacterium]
MGSDKAFLKLRGRPLVARAVELARQVTPEVSIVGDAEKFAPYGRVISDIFLDRGPLGGIHAALAASGSDWNLFLAVDLPFLTAPLLNYLLEQAKSSGAVITVPSAHGYFQPLCAVYRRRFAAVAERALREGRNKIDALFPSVTVRFIPEEELKGAGYSSSMFRNLNTPDEWKRAQGELEQE